MGHHDAGREHQTGAADLSVSTTGPVLAESGQAWMSASDPFSAVHACGKQPFNATPSGVDGQGPAPATHSLHKALPAGRQRELLTADRCGQTAGCPVIETAWPRHIPR